MTFIPKPVHFHIHAFKKKLLVLVTSLCFLRFWWLIDAYRSKSFFSVHSASFNNTIASSEPWIDGSPLYLWKILSFLFVLVHSWTLIPYRKRCSWYMFIYNSDSTTYFFKYSRKVVVHTLLDIRCFYLWKATSFRSVCLSISMLSRSVCFLDQYAESVKRPVLDTGHRQWFDCSQQSYGGPSYVVHHMWFDYNLRNKKARLNDEILVFV